MKIFNNLFIPGFVAIIITIIFFGGINLLFMGILGIYISKIYEESKSRPLYVIDEKINF